MIKRIKITEKDISWSSFRCASKDEQEKVMAEVESVLNSIIFAKTKEEIESVVDKYILKSNVNRVRKSCFITFLSFNNREGEIIRYSLKDQKIVATILDAKTKNEICVKEGFYGWKSHRIYNRDVTNSLYRILYPPKWNRHK